MFKIGNVYHGFKLIEESTIDELQSIGRLFVHDKTGARLLHLENEDNNKVFSIAFRTPPTDDTGVPHIIEHCVLAGSKKYTTKEPFMDMVKSSLRTFINAMTFPDKTMYPVASRNEKDFNNLMDVYLDAVFFPKIYEIPEIFMQEGWHHEIFNKEDEIIYKGVVYNEMKGAYSSPETILNRAATKSLLPDTCYAYSSGGDPDFIPNLTSEDFLNFHKKLYHPTNSYLYLYGDGDILKQLAHINDNYLIKFDKIEIDSTIKRQIPLEKHVELIDYYHISKEESDSSKTYLNFNFLTGDSTDETSLMNNIITQILIQSDAAPLKKALLAAKIGEDVFATSGGGLDSFVGFVAKNTTEAKKDDFKNIIFATLNKLVNEGIDKELIKASINVIEYRLREASGFSTKGIVYKMIAMENWLYDKNPIAKLKYNDALNKIKANVDNNYFEQYIKDYILNNKNTSLVIVKPQKGLANDKEEALKAKLKQFKAQLTPAELESLILANKKLKEMQMAPDTEEAKRTIPKLSLADVEVKAEVIPQKVYHEKGYTLLHQDIFTSKIAYLNLYFDVSMIEETDIPYINLLTTLLTRMNTSKRTYEDLSNAIYANTGGIGVSTEVFVKEDNSDEILPKITVNGKAIGENIKTLIDLMSEIIFETKLDNDNRIKELLYQLKSRTEMVISFRGNAVVSNRVSSYYSEKASYQDKLNGLSFYWFISDLIADYDNKKQEMIERLKYVYQKVFNKNNLIISFTGDEEDLLMVKENIKTIFAKLKQTEYRKATYRHELKKLNEGILSNYHVQYVAKGYDYQKLGYSFHGSFRVISTILNGDYLHNRVRAQGGAYGVNISFDRVGNLIVSSYRDPNLKETIWVFDNIYEFVNNLSLTDIELSQYIIGSIAQLEPALTPSQMGQLQTARYISGTTQAMMQQMKDEILATNLEQLKATSIVFEKAMKEDYLCVLGNENKIKANEDTFLNLVKLIK